MRKVPQAFENEFKTTIHKMIKHGLIRASRSPWSSPVRLVRKKDGSMRITVDYRKLNGVTIKDAYPIPNINNMLNHLSKGRLFTTLDLHSGYFQLPMDPASSQYTAFTCEFGFFEYVVMPQGLCNATATFQRAMTLALGDLIGKICYCYLDDVIIFSEDPDQHLEHVKMVRDRLKQHNLKIKMSKCKFAQPKSSILVT
jgi:putative transposase